jgi:hypothetical protein
VRCPPTSLSLLDPLPNLHFGERKKKEKQRQLGCDLHCGK